jgi:hypothetical protein
VLSDEEYEVMLREKLLRVNAELAIIDDKMEKLRKVAGHVGEQRKRIPNHGNPFRRVPERSALPPGFRRLNLSKRFQW